MEKNHVTLLLRNSEYLALSIHFCIFTPMLCKPISTAGEMEKKKEKSRRSGPKTHTHQPDPVVNMWNMLPINKGLLEPYTVLCVEPFCGV